MARITKEQTVRQQFINNIMRDGKKLKASLIVDNLNCDYTEAIKKIQPLVKVKTVRKGKRNIQMPFPLTVKQQTRISIKWIQQEAEKLKMPFKDGLEKVVKGILANSSPLLGKRDMMHKQALQNRSNLVLVDRKR